MTIENKLKVYWNSDKEKVYELTAVCKDAGEVMQVFNALHLHKTIEVDCFKDYDVAIISEAWRHSTKEAYIDAVKNLLK